MGRARQVRNETPSVAGSPTAAPLTGVDEHDDPNLTSTRLLAIADFAHVRLALVTGSKMHPLDNPSSIMITRSPRRR